MPRIRLEPLGISIDLARGESLSDALFAHGVEFPCGGHGRCKGCRVRVAAGRVEAGDHDRRAFTPDALAAGWRLACHLEAKTDCSLELAQWETPILADDSTFDFSPRPGFGIAVDIGTTTMVAQLVELPTSAVRAVRSALNPQTRHGADLMTRLDHALHGGASELRDSLRQAIGKLIAGLLQATPEARDEVQAVTVVGNTAIHHLFLGLDCSSLAQHPFEPVARGAQRCSARELGWDAIAGAQVDVLPILGGFVGPDILGGLLATRMHQQEGLQVLLDLGTNGEVAVGNRERILVTSTAAGPAFEGARIAQGMRAATGAITGVSVRDGGLVCRVAGGGAARGICGSGLVDAVAGGLELDLIGCSGRLTGGRQRLPLADGVALTQQDLRELQLAKGAIAAGIHILLQRWGAGLEDVERVYLAGAFGNYIDLASARRIGLLPFAPEQVTAAGNTALLGAKIALFCDDLEFTALRAPVEHVSLKADLAFSDRYIEEMAFPEALPPLRT